MTRIVILFATVLFALLPAQAAESEWRQIMIEGLKKGALGVFDPSLASADNGATLYMSFSAVDPESSGLGGRGRHVSTHLAVSRDRGETWDYVTALNAPQEGRKGALWHQEVSSLAYDGQAPRGKRWTLLTHHFPLKDGKRQFAYGWIGLKQAARPEALSSAPETKWLVGKRYKPGKDLGTPLPGLPAIHGNKLHKDLANCIVFTEPGLLARHDALYLALGCAEWGLISGVRVKVALLRCARPCTITDPAAWTYERSLKPRQGKKINAADLFEGPRGMHLVATPVSNKPFKDAYNGCMTFAVTREGFEPADPTFIEGLPGSFNGACTVYHGPNGRLFLLSQLKLTPQGARFTIQALR